VGTFHIRSFLSNYTGTQKYYSAKESFARENKVVLAGPVIELFDMGARRVFYIAPVK
jgi:hypothetical protein